MLVLLLAVLIVLVAAPAADAALVERPFEPMPGGAVATCLRATGAPGGLARFGPFMRHRAATDLRTAGADATALDARVQIGTLVDCAATATAASGAAIVAGAVLAGDSSAEVRAVARDPGGRFGGRATLASADSSPAAAVSPAGHAVVAWVQRRGSEGAEHPPRRIVVSRRAPGGGFGSLEALTPWRRSGEATPAVTAAMDAAGVATVAWTLPIWDREYGNTEISSVVVASAAPATPFTVQHVTTGAEQVSRPALAVASEGWTLLAYDAIDGIHAFDRPPGAEQFTETLHYPPVRGAQSEADMPVVAVRDGGGGLVGWRSNDDAEIAGVIAAVRSAAGPFARPLALALDTGSSENGAGGVAFPVGGPPFDDRNGALRAALAADGRAVLAWTADVRGVTRTHAAEGSLAMGFGTPTRLGSPVWDANGVAPLFLPDGRAAVAWTDNASRYGFGIATDHGRLRLAVESGPAMPEAPAPRMTLTARRTQRLFDSQPLLVRVACERACDLRIVVSGAPPSAFTRSVAGTGAVRLSLPPYDYDPSLPRPRRRLVRVRATAPAAHPVTTASVRVRVVRRPPLPVPPPLDVRAVRRGDSIVVSWHTASPARRATYRVDGMRRRWVTVDSLRDPGLVRYVEGGGRTRFIARLRPLRPTAVNWVAVYSSSNDYRRAPRRVLVRVPG